VRERLPPLCHKAKTYNKSVFVTAELIERSAVADAEAKASPKTIAKTKRQVDRVLWAESSIWSVRTDDTSAVDSAISCIRAERGIVIPKPNGTSLARWNTLTCVGWLT
jgi:hypothetical protein